MVSLDRVNVLGSWYMATHGGYKPNPKAFLAYFNERKLKPKRIFFLGNRVVDMKLADTLKKKLKCEVLKCLILRSGDGLANKYDDVLVRNLKQVSDEIKKFKPDLVMSDFDNTLMHSGYNSVESAVERTRFWEHFNDNWFVRVIYGIGSHLAIPFIIPILRRHPYQGQHDNTEAFIKKLKTPLLIHTMGPEVLVRQALKKII